jgi:hypothetical protein
MITNAYITIEAYENLIDAEPYYQFKGKPTRQYVNENSPILHWTIITDSRLCDINKLKKGMYLNIKYGNLQGKYPIVTITPHIWTSGKFEYILSVN